MVDLVAEHEPEELHLRNVSHGAGTREELHRSSQIVVARRLQRVHHLRVSLEKCADGLAPALGRLRKAAAEVQLVLESEQDEPLLDREGPYELPRGVRTRMRLELRLVRGERLDHTSSRAVFPLERFY